MGVTLTCRSETFAKHEFCLGRTGNAPPTPDLSIPIAYPIDQPRAAYRIISQTVTYPATSDTDSISIAAFSAVIDDGRTIALPSGTIEGLAAGTEYVVLWSLSAQAYSAMPSPAIEALASPDYVLVRYVTTQNVDGTYPGTPTAPGGDGGGGGGRYTGNEAVP